MKPQSTTGDPRAVTVNEWIARRPEALTVLHGHGIDACCGGALTLEEACSRHGLDIEAILGELAAKPVPD